MLKYVLLVFSVHILLEFCDFFFKIESIKLIQLPITCEDSFRKTLVQNLLKLVKSKIMKKKPSPDCTVYSLKQIFNFSFIICISFNLKNTKIALHLLVSREE